MATGNIDDPQGHAKWKKLVTKGNTVWIHSYETLRVVKFTETESRRVVAKSWGRGKWYCLIGIVSVLQAKKFWRLMMVVAAQQCECT